MFYIFFYLNSVLGGSISPATGGSGPRMVSPGGAGGPGAVPGAGQIRPPLWSGETHPALAQVENNLL